MKLYSAVLTLFLVMDPLGNIPPFLSVLKNVQPERRRRVLVREILIAYGVLLVFLFLGKRALALLSLQQETISVAGGIVLFLIALRMVFPQDGGLLGESLEGEPFIVPLAIPLIAGPSALAVLLLLEQSAPNVTGRLLLAVTIAWALSALILLSSTLLYRVLKQRGLIAMERLMGMLLVMLAVQMFMNGVADFLKR
ncbi:MAG TPA: YhgN family NAAT transporter [Pyrinomonadaceae bacterium]|nr:YhgN family NAAT transporter [Pyrinomonadaceae bacterium]